MEKKQDDHFDFEEESPPSLLSSSGGFWENAPKKSLIVGALIVLAAVLLVTTIFSRDRDVAHVQQMQAPSHDLVERMQARFERLEERIDAVEMQLTRLPALVHQVESLEVGDSTGRFDQVVARIDRLDRQINDIQKETLNLKNRQQAFSEGLSQTRAAAPVSETPAPSGSTRYYDVQKGDTLYSIARANGIPLNTLLANNGLSEDSVIRPGDRLVIRK